MDLIHQRIGRLRIVERLGQGGMGEVYVAHDETLDRRVALKAIRADQRLDDEARARFLREARVLSRLDHPSICRLYELIESEHGLFLSLELIEGQSLKRALAEGLEPSARYFIAERIAEALMAAHARGIVHRDLKPDNVMLTDRGEVKVLDFGLASVFDSAFPMAEGFAGAGLSDPDGADEAPEPESGSVSKTLLAMPDDPPPEDGTAGSHFVEPRRGATVTLLGSDGIEGGALSRDQGGASCVGELLADKTEFATQRGTVMGTIAYMSPEQALGERAAATHDMYSYGLLMQEIFTGRPAYPKGLGTLELLTRAAAADTLPAEGIDPDLQLLISELKSPSPESRPTAREALERLTWIREKRRRWWRRSGLAAAGLLLVAALFKYTHDLRRQTVAAARAQAEAEQISAFLLDAFSLTRPERARGREITADELLGRGADRLESLEGQPRLRASLMLTIGQAQRQLGLYDQARPQLEGALEILRVQHGSSSLAEAAPLDQLANLEHELGNFEQAVLLSREALRVRRRHLPGDHPHIATSLNNLAVSERARGEDTAAEELLIEALGLHRGQDPPDSRAIAGCLMNLGDLYRAQNRPGEASKVLAEAIELYRVESGDDHPELATGYNNLAAVRVEQGRLTEAEGLYGQALDVLKRILPDGHPRLGAALNNLAEVERRRGRFTVAEELYGKALTIQAEAFGDSHPEWAGISANLAGSLLARGELAAARERYRQALAIQQQAYGVGGLDTASTLHRLADLEVEAGDDGAAQELYRRALDILEESPTSHAGHVGIAVDLAELLIRVGRLDEAETVLESVDRDLGVSELQAESGQVRRAVRIQGARVLLARGRLEQARGRSGEEAWRRALELLPAGAEDLGDRHYRAVTLLLLDHWEQARALLEELRASGWRSRELDTLFAASAHD